MFHHFASKLRPIIACVLIHQLSVARCAPPGPFPDGSPPEAVSMNPFASNNTTVKNPLLDETKLPFLSSCYDETVSVSGKLCVLYHYLATSVLAHRKPEPVTVDEVRNVMTAPMDADSFCDNLVPVLCKRKVKHPEFIDVDIPLEVDIICSGWCLEKNGVMTDLSWVVKPVCKVLLWGYRQEVLSEDYAKKSVAHVGAPPISMKNDEDDLEQDYNIDEEYVDPHSYSYFVNHEEKGSATEATQTQLEPVAMGGRNSDGFELEPPTATTEGAVLIERVDQGELMNSKDASTFYSYFTFVMFACIVCYLALYYKSTLPALLEKGRKYQKQNKKMAVAAKQELIAGALLSEQQQVVKVVS